MEEQEKCVLCKTEGKKFKLGYKLLKGIICNDCYILHLKKVIKEIDVFIKSKDFDDLKKAKLKLLWINQEMNDWLDLNYLKEPLDYYKEFSLRKLKLHLSGHCLTLTENLMDALGLEKLELFRQEHLKINKKYAKFI